MSFFSIPRPPCSTLFPYTTLFRSNVQQDCGASRENFAGPTVSSHPALSDGLKMALTLGWAFPVKSPLLCLRFWGVDGVKRSEEHTSELQSQSNIVCRLLLEKKNHT